MVRSAFILDPNTTTSLSVSQRRFEDVSTDYDGSWLYSSLRDVKVRDSNVLGDSGSVGLSFFCLWRERRVRVWMRARQLRHVRGGGRLRLVRDRRMRAMPVRHVPRGGGRSGRVAVLAV
mmetsp:Transcript_29967/g.51482  ORF Transcript_29967/g.51482 Transcript_29967/m.51482 type:complete len:119 (+) Transcript_29967:706-1062(+)